MYKKSTVYMYKYQICCSANILLRSLSPNCCTHPIARNGSLFENSDQTEHINRLITIEINLHILAIVTILY